MYEHHVAVFHQRACGDVLDFAEPGVQRLNDEHAFAEKAIDGDTVRGPLVADQHYCNTSAGPIPLRDRKLLRVATRVKPGVLPGIQNAGIHSGVTDAHVIGTTLLKGWECHETETFRMDRGVVDRVDID
jgi:hypothetical protein